MLTGFSVPSYVVFTSLSYRRVLLNDLPRKREGARGSVTISARPPRHTTACPLPVKEKNLALLIPPPRPLRCPCIPVAKTGPFFFFTRPLKIPAGVNHRLGDFVNLRPPPTMSAGVVFCRQGSRPDDAKCLKVGDLYGLQTTLFPRVPRVGRYLERPTEVKLIILINERVFTRH